ncbi:MAG: glutaredoxin family protein [Candidatus Sedimenticola sp. PURPLELP]
MSESEVTRFTLFSRQGCHLCEDMRWQLQQLQQERAFDFDEVDIASDPSLEKLYGTLIPVLTQDNRVVCNYYLDPVAVAEILDRG